MFLNSVISEGLAGTQQSHKRIQQAAEDIVKAGMPTDGSIQNVGESGSGTITNNGSSASDLPSTQAVGASTEAESLNSSLESPANMIESLLTMEQQKLVFDASAKVIEVGSHMVGQVIDDIS